MSGGGTDRRRDADVKERSETVRPRRFHVILFNDDYTTQEFVVFLLESLFKKSPAEAWQVMLKVHHEGRGIAGTYPRDIAETKVQQVHERARSAGHPLRAGLEEA